MTFWNFLKFNILIILITINIIILLFLLNFIKQDIVKIFIINNKDFIIGISAILVGITFWFFDLIYNRNKLFSEIITEYSTESVGNAIRDICDFIKNNNCIIKINDTKEQKIKKKVDIAKKYIKLKKDNYKKWIKIDNQRRLIANYYIKIGIFLNKLILTKKLIKLFWNEQSLLYLKEYIITLEYVALPLILDFKQENSLKKPLLLNFYNSLVKKENQINKFELEIIYKNIYKINKV